MKFEVSQCAPLCTDAGDNAPLYRHSREVRIKRTRHTPTLIPTEQCDNGVNVLLTGVIILFIGIHIYIRLYSLRDNN